MWIFDKGAFVQLILNPDECVRQLLMRMRPLEMYECVFSSWGRVKNLTKKGHHKLTTNKILFRQLKHKI